MKKEMEERIAGLARRQHGLATRRQLLELGLSSGALDRHVGRGRLRRLRRGVYLVGPILPSRAREMAAVLACGPDALVSHLSAASLREWTAPQTASAPVDITIIRSHNHPRPGIRIHRTRTLRSDERADLDGIPVTGPTRTLLDLAGVADGRVLERAVARAERRAVRRADLEALVARHRGRPGVPLLRAILTTSGGPALTRSEAEDRFLALVRTARLPAPEVNAWVGGYEVDFFWREARLAVEVDGYRFHSSLPSFEHDRRRATHLAAIGIQVVPLTWRQVVEEDHATAVQIGQALVQARGR
ncbi:MAG: type IV toxin-antitoxin system AbiEi family antitoxin domain-containing protein [Longimicrobiales bacterium]